MSEPTFTRSEVLRILREVQHRTGWTVVRHALDVQPLLATPTSERHITPGTFELKAQEAKRSSSGTMFAVRDTLPAPPIPREEPEE